MGLENIEVRVTDTFRVRVWVRVWVRVKVRRRLMFLLRNASFKRTPRVREGEKRERTPPSPCVSVSLRVHVIYDKVVVEGEKVLHQLRIVRKGLES